MLKFTKQQHWRDWLEKAKDPNIWAAYQLILAPPMDREKAKIPKLKIKLGKANMLASSNEEKSIALAKCFFPTKLQARDANAGVKYLKQGCCSLVPNLGLDLNLSEPDQGSVQGLGLGLNQTDGSGLGLGLNQTNGSGLGLGLNQTDGSGSGLGLLQTWQNCLEPGPNPELEGQLHQEMLKILFFNFFNFF